MRRNVTPRSREVGHVGAARYHVAHRARRGHRDQSRSTNFLSRTLTWRLRALFAAAVSTLLLACLALVPAQAALSLPDPAFTSPAEGWGSVGPFACAPAGTFRVGTRAFANLVTTGTSYSVSGFRDCNSTVGIAQSQHKTGRAVDIGINYDVPTQRADGQQLLNWLFANGAERLRRLGIVEIIWGGARWYTSSDTENLNPDTRSWQGYTGLGCLGKDDVRPAYDDECHRDHFHFTLSVAGSEKQTSFWASSAPAPIDLSVRNAPASIIDATDRISLYATRSDGNLWGASQATPGGGLSSWSIIGSAVGTLQGRPAVLRLSSGIIAAYARTTAGTIVGTNQTTIGGSFTPWTTIGSAGNGIASDPVVIQLASGIIAIYATTDAGTVSGVAQSMPGGAFTSWTTIGASSLEFLGRPAVVRYSDDRIGLFVRGSDNQVQSAVQAAPGSSFGAWTPTGSGGGGITTEPTAVMVNDRVTVFAGAGSTLATVTQATAGAPFGGWVNHGSGPTSVGGATPAVVVSPGLASGYALGDDRTVWGISVNPEQATSGWAQIGSGASLATALTGLRTSYGVNCIYGADTGGRVVGTCQAGPGQAFGGWATLL